MLAPSTCSRALTSPRSTAGLVHEEPLLIDIEVGAAVLAGLIAGTVMEGPGYLQKALGLPLKQNIFRTWGILFGQRGAAGYVIGFLFHSAIAVFAAVLYAVAFNLIGVEGDLWLYGLLGGLIHYTLAGPIVAVIPSLNPDTGNLREQGFAYKNYGALDVVSALVGHLAFGTLTGILYGYFHSGSGLAF
jgi:hypothetical protein